MKKINDKDKRKLRNRKKLKAVNVNRYRVSVSKSLNNLFAQIIDDKQKKTLVSASSIEKEIKAKKVKNKNLSSGKAWRMSLLAGNSDTETLHETYRQCQKDVSTLKRQLQEKQRLKWVKLIEKEGAKAVEE